MLLHIAVRLLCRDNSSRGPRGLSGTEGAAPGKGGRGPWGPRARGARWRAGHRAHLEEEEEEEKGGGEEGAASYASAPGLVGLALGPELAGAPSWPVLATLVRSPEAGGSAGPGAAVERQSILFDDLRGPARGPESASQTSPEVSSHGRCTRGAPALEGGPPKGWLPSNFDPLVGGRQPYT